MTTCTPAKNKKSKRVTLKSIAQHLGLGATTVSDILLRNKTNYKEETIKKVKAAAQQMGYTPNLLAQGLCASKTNTIGLLVNHNILNPFFARIVNTIVNKIENDGRHVFVSIVDGDLHKASESLRLFESRQVDAVIITPIYARLAIENISHHFVSKLPTVVCISNETEVDYDVVDFSQDHREMGRIITEYLMSKGHTKIGYLMCPDGPRKDIGGQTYRGYYEALNEQNIYNEDWVWINNNAIAPEAYQLMKHILNVNPPENLPTAFYCHNDHCAMGAMAAIHEAGFSVPGDFSIIGSDDLDFAAYSNPGLTTIRKDPELMANVTIELLNNRLNNPDAPQQAKYVKTELIERNSVSAPKIFK